MTAASGASRAALPVLLVASLLGAACTVKGPGASPATATVAPPRAGGTLVVAWQQPDTLDPLYAAGVQAAAAIYSLAVEGLVRPQPDGSTGAQLAREVPTLENGLVTLSPEGGMTVRYRLQPRVTWSDGAPLTSADVAYTWRRIMSDPKVSTREGYDRIARIDTPDELTADVVYRSLYPAYLTRFDAVLPKHALEGATDFTAYGSAPLGTGPFRIVEFARGDHVTAQRNERYRDPQRPYLDAVIFRFVSSLEAAKSQLRAGEVHAAFNVSEADAIDLEKDPGIALDSARSPIVESLSFNVERPQLADRAVRRALVLATPKGDIVSTLLGGKARAGASEIPLGWASAPDVAQEGYDLARARQVLDDAGWLPGADGVRRKGDVRLAIAITSTTGNPLREQIEQVLVDRWREIGVAATIRNVPSQSLTAPYSSNGIRKRGDFDAVLHQLGLGTIGGTDPQAYLDQRHRCDAVPREANKGAGGNWERFCDPAVDRLLADAGRTLDPVKRRAAYAEVLRIVNDQALDVWIFERARINAFRSTVSGYSPNAWDVPTWNIASWQVRR